MKSQKGFTGVSIAVSVIVIFIFVTLIATLIYNYNSTIKETQLRAEATAIAVQEIEKIKADGFEKYESYNHDNYISALPQNVEVKDRILYDSDTLGLRRFK